MKKYNRRVWLNPPSSSFTGSIICYDGHFINDCGNLEEWKYVEISDCHSKSRIHIGRDKNKKRKNKAFLAKVKKMRDELDMFIKHLEEKEA